MGNGRKAIWGGLFWLHCFTLITAVAWILIDPNFPRTVHWLWIELVGASPDQVSKIKFWSQLGGHLLAIKIMAGVIVASGLGVLSGLFLGPPRFRGIRAWLAVMTLAGCWLAVGTSWGQLAWYGKRLRVARVTPAFNLVLTELRNDWPTEDGQIPIVGPFNAYPIGDPTVLMLLSRPGPPFGEITFSTVEKSPTGGIRFLLNGTEYGDWLEWHPHGEIPVSFQGGLGENHRIVRSSPLGSGWYLARYHVHREE